MTDTQVLTIVIAILASLGALIYNNSRITDVGKRIDDQRDSLGKRLDEQSQSLGKRLEEQSQSLGKRIDELHNSVNERFNDVNRHIDDKYHLLDVKLDRIIEMLASHDQRLYKLEHPSEQS